MFVAGPGQRRAVSCAQQSALPTNATTVTDRTTGGTLHSAEVTCQRSELPTCRGLVTAISACTVPPSDVGGAHITVSTHSEMKLRVVSILVELYAVLR